MKKIFYLVFISILSVNVFSSCTSKQDKTEKPSAHEEFVSSLSSADTTEVINLCQEFFNKLSSGDKESAIAMLSLSTESGEVVAMTDEKAKSLNSQFTLFPVLDNHLVDYKFGESADNLIRYKIVFAKDDQGKEETINFGLNPIRKNGKWYLTVRNATAKVAE